MGRRGKNDSSRHKARAARAGGDDVRPPEPVDVVGGVADRTSNVRLWKYLIAALIFLGWVAFLAYCRIAGAPGP